MEESAYLNAGTKIGSREEFVSRTYAHLLGAVLGFIALELLIFSSGIAAPLAALMLSGSWLIVLGAFVVVGWIASRVAHSVESLPMQYAALAGYVLAEAIIFVPLLFIADRAAPGSIEAAGIVTVVAFAILTMIVHVSRKDFSFLGSLLMWLGVGAFGLIVVDVLYGLSLGPIFAMAMVVFAGAAILHDTSNVIHHYPEDRYVAAALELFASIALMFWYMIQLAMSVMGRD